MVNNDCSTDFEYSAAGQVLVMVLFIVLLIALNAKLILRVYSLVYMFGLLVEVMSNLLLFQIYIIACFYILGELEFIFMYLLFVIYFSVFFFGSEEFF